MYKNIKKMIDSIKKNGITYTLSHGTNYLIDSVFLPKFGSVMYHPARLLLNSTECRFNDIFRQKRIGIIGRGPSVKSLHELDFVRSFVIVNGLDMQNPITQDYLNDKNLLHFGAISEPTLSVQSYYQFNFAGYQLRTTKSSDGTYPWRDEIGRGGVGNPEMYGFKPKYLPNEVDEILRKKFSPDGINTCGLMAVLYAAEMSNADEVYTAGIDFYDLDISTDMYLSSKNLSEEEKLDLRARSQDMMEDMNTIAGIYDNKQFHIITHSTYDPDIENITIHRRGVSSIM